MLLAQKPPALLSRRLKVIKNDTCIAADADHTAQPYLSVCASLISDVTEVMHVVQGNSSLDSSRGSGSPSEFEVNKIVQQDLETTGNRQSPEPRGEAEAKGAQQKAKEDRVQGHQQGGWSPQGLQLLIMHGNVIASSVITS